MFGSWVLGWIYHLRFRGVVGDKDQVWRRVFRDKVAILNLSFCEEN